MKRALILTLSVIGMTIAHKHHHHDHKTFLADDTEFIPQVAGCTLGSVIQGGSQCQTSVAAGLTAQIANEMTAMGITFSKIASPRIQCGGGCSGYI